MEWLVENDDLPIRDLVMISAGPNLGKVLEILRTRLGFTMAQAREAIKGPEKLLASDSRMGLEDLINGLTMAGATVELR